MLVILWSIFFLSVLMYIQLWHFIYGAHAQQPWTVIDIYRNFYVHQVVYCILQFCAKCISYFIAFETIYVVEIYIYCFFLFVKQYKSVHRYFYIVRVVGEGVSFCYFNEYKYIIQINAYFTPIFIFDLTARCYKDSNNTSPISVQSYVAKFIDRSIYRSTSFIFKIPLYFLRNSYIKQRFKLKISNTDDFMQEHLLKILNC